MSFTEPGKNYTFLIADEHPVIRSILKTIINKQTGFTASLDVAANLSEIKELIELVAYDIIILDVHAEDGDSKRMIPLIKFKQPQAKILIFSMGSANFNALQLIHEGVRGILIKTAPEHEISKAIITILNGERYFSPDFLQ